MAEATSVTPEAKPEGTRDFIGGEDLIESPLLVPPEDTELVAPDVEVSADVGDGPQEQGAFSIPAGDILVNQSAEEGFAIPEGDIHVGTVEPPPTLAEKVIGRFTGSDIEDDPFEMTRLATTIGGAITGGTAGLQTGVAIGSLGGPFAYITVPVVGTAGTLIGGATGAFIGSGAPEGIANLEDNLKLRLGLIDPEDVERVGLSPLELRTVQEGEFLLDLATGGGLTVARGLGRGVVALGTGAKKGLAEAAARQGIDLTPVMVGDRPIGKGFVAVFGRFPFLGGGKIRKAGEKTEQQIRARLESLASRTGPITDGGELSELIFKDAKVLVKKFNEDFGAQYDKLFADAAELGVGADPKTLLAKTDELLKEIKLATPTAVKGKKDPTAGAVLEKVKSFMEDEILVMRRLAPKAVAPVDTLLLDAGGKKILREVPSLPATVQRQTFAQLDGLISKIDQQLAVLDPKSGEQKIAIAYYTQLRQALQEDTLKNLRGPGALEIRERLKKLNETFSQTLHQVFETATAKRFGSVETKGLRSVAQLNKATRQNIDQLSRFAIKQDSPQAMEELSRLVTPETFKKIAAFTLDDAMRKAVVRTGEGANQFNIDRFARRLGLDGTNPTRRRALGVMLKEADSPLTLKDLDEIIAVGRKMSEFEIPNVSSFIARRAAISGARGAGSALVPGLAIAGGYSLTGLMGAAVFVGGSNLWAKMLADPLSARALHKVISKEGSRLIKKKAVVTALFRGLEAQFNDGEITKAELVQKKSQFGVLIDEADKQLGAAGIKLKPGIPDIFQQPADLVGEPLS